jgi:calcineurin-like phosphoesterase family protein
MFDAFISDPHFGHKRIIEYCKRPFANVQEMNEQMIKNYNDVVGTNGKVLWTGDCFFYGNKEARAIMDQLNGEKYVVLGNHDADAHKMVSRGFKWAVDKLYFKIAGRNIVACHYDQAMMRNPWDDRYMELRPKLEESQILIHGHTHQKIKVLLDQVHLGVDSWDYRPATHDEVADLVKSIPVKWTNQMNKELKDLQKYSETIRLIKQLRSIGSDCKLQEDILASDRFDKFRGLGWEGETKERAM